MAKRIWKVVGLMSGTSLDGLDVALCEFVTEEGELREYHIVQATTYEYSQEEKNKLSLMGASALTLAESDFWFGYYCGNRVLQFLDDHRLEAELVASHGHTVFHQPNKRFTTQIGNGAAISATCLLPVVSDFRSMDVAMGGQGAPLVPIGDLLLFKEDTFCLNLGGIANISAKIGSGIVAYDICPVNMALNLLANEKGLAYDQGGNLAKTGHVDANLLKQLQKLDFYTLDYPKSLGKEWFDRTFFPLLANSPLSVEDRLATTCEHIALQIAREVKRNGSISEDQMLVTGGGAFNSFLIANLSEKLANICKVKVPAASLVSFKEALIFAFLGWCRIQNKANALRSVTGAVQDNMGGALYGDFSKLMS